MKRKKAEAIWNTLRQSFVETFGNDGELLACGSWARRKLEMKDLDLLAVTERVDEVVEWFHRVTRDAGGGKKRLSGKVRGETVELMLTDKAHRGAAILHVTGSGAFNVKLRTVAMKRGMILSQYGLRDRKTNEMIKAGATEGEIFDALGIPYLRPEQRGAEGVGMEILRLVLYNVQSIAHETVESDRRDSKAKQICPNA